MSKKNTGLLIAFGAALGAAAACVSYYLKYKSFSDELDKDFHDYEDEEESGAAEGENVPAPCSEASKRNYITIDGGKCKCSEASESAPLNNGEQNEEPEKTAAPKEAPVSKETSADVTVEEDTEGTEA